MKHLIAFVLSVFTLVTMQAQLVGEIATNLGVGGSTANTGAIATLDSALDGPGTEKKEYIAKDYSGSPYVSDKFIPTSLFYKDDKIGSIFYRHNALNEEVEIMKANVDGELVRSLAKDKNLNIRSNGKKMSFKTFVTVKKKTANGYLIELYNGEDYDLYKRIKVKYTEGTPAQNSFIAAVPAKFSKFTEYYFQKKGVNRIDEIVSNNKLLKLLDDSKKAMVKTYLKENNLNIKNEADLIKVFEFLNK